MKTKLKLRARRMWANYYGDFVACHDTRRTARAEADAGHPSALDTIPVAVVPLDDVEALVGRATAAYVDACHSHVTVTGRVAYMLTAIGVLPRQRKGGRK